MKVHILRQMGYEGTQIYVMHFSDVFMYLFSWNDEIFKQHVIVKPSLFSKIRHELYGRPLYSLGDLEGAEQAMLTGAMDSIDELKGQKKVKVKVLKSERKCMWQVRKTKDETPLYKCINHGNEVPFVEGALPSHKIDNK